MVRDILVNLLNESATMEKMIPILQSMLTENTMCITIDPPLIESIFCRQPVPKDLPQAKPYYYTTRISKEVWDYYRAYEDKPPSH